MGAQLLEALYTIVQPGHIQYLLIGVALGLAIGVLPGLGGAVGMSILLPFVFGMEPSAGVAMLMGMAAVVHTSDTFPSVLLGVPGSSGSQATIMDGYPLARAGESSRALGAAFFCSMVGGIFGAFLLVGTIVAIRPLVLAMGSPQLFMLSMLGVSMVGILSRGSSLTGLIAAALGLLLGMIGAAPGAPVYRYTFDSLYLFDGVPVAVTALGLFAIPELVDLLYRGEAISKASSLGGRLRDGMRDAIEHKWLVLRSAALGTGVGAIPGLGGAVVDWIAYGVTVQTSKDKSKFGHGDIRGVIGPESANNAKEAGSLIPTLLFGIPGSGNMAILLGGLIMLGIQPGPAMVGRDLSITFVIVWTLVLANILGVIGCLLFSTQISKIALVPMKLLFPFLFSVMTLAAYQSTRHWGDILAFITIGAIGWVMKQVGWPRAPVLIGYVLAVPAERFLTRSVSLYGLEWLRFPSIIVMAIVILTLTILGSKRSKNIGTGPTPAAVGGDSRDQAELKSEADRL